jgi:hypothetical protein
VRQRVHERIGDVGSSALPCLASHYHALLTAIINEQRARHYDVAT